MNSRERVRALPILLGLVVALVCGAARAQHSERFGPYELHFSVVNTTFLDPKVAGAYGITRGEKRAILNLALREDLADGESAPRAMQIEGTVRDLIQSRQALDFKEIREQGAIYYIAEFRFINEEWRFFDIEFRPEGSDRVFSHSFKRQLYID